jgi:hypothetical protein
MTTKHANVYAALAAVQVEIGAIEKSGKNPQTRSAYIPLGVLRARCIPVLARHGLLLTHDSEISEPYLMVHTTVTHCDSGHKLSATVPIAPQRPGATRDEVHSGATHYTSHAMASAITYGSRVGMQALLGITDVEDDDGNAASGKAQQAAPKSKPVKSPSSDRQAKRKTTDDKGKRAAALGSIIKSAIALGHLPPDAPKVPHADNVDALRSMVGEAVAGPGVQPQLTEVSTGELERAAEHWRQQRAEGEIPA